MSNFQDASWAWIRECFGEEFAHSQEERTLRFLEEALELAQAAGLNRQDAEHLVDYVYNRPAGEVKQEVGGVVVCLGALCSAAGIDMERAGWEEHARCKLHTDRIRQKHLAKGPGIRTGHE
jgi:hypothetical protein